MVGWHHQLNGPESEQTPGAEGQGDLACSSPWGCKESDMSERLNNSNKSELIYVYFIFYFFKFYFIFKLYIIVLVLPNIKMNPPQVYMCSPF